VTSLVGLAWRFAALGGLTLGLALAQVAQAPSLTAPMIAGLIAALVIARPRRRGAIPWVCAVAGAALLSGLAAGDARLAAIDAGALRLAEGEQVEARGTIVSTPKASNGTTRFVLEVDGERIGVETATSTGEVDEGRTVAVAGTVREPSPWEAGGLARDGAARILVAERVRATRAVRGGFRGVVDGIRRRAESALERGTPEASAALLRGFVLGQDDRIPEPVRDDFRRSGLAHVLAVSGQNVMLLALLAAPILAISGVPLRARLVVLVALIAVYVPVAGAGASIQRAGVMGAAGLVAVLAGRPRARWYALLLAAAATLALDPRATGDVGWQLSFAAVAGLLAVAGPVAEVLGAHRGGPGRRLFAEGAAMTLAATLATAPLAAHHFGTVSLTAIPANLLALPAIAPAMWLGMLAGAVGQVPAAPVEPLTALGGLCAGYIGWVARALGPEAAQLEIAEPGIWTAIALAVGALAGARLVCTALGRRVGLGARRGRRGHARPAAAIAIASTAFLVLIPAWPGRELADPVSDPRLRIRILDVGQGDSILLEPRDALPVLIDTGPPDGGAADRLRDLGIDRLGALAITHDQLDHSGAIAEVLSEAEVSRLVHARGAAPAHCRTHGCPDPRPVVAGDRIRVGALRLDVLWPPAGELVGNGDPNAGSVVLRARTGRFEALFTGDAEAELAPIDAGPVDLLKVAHHGSADAGLSALLTRASPQLAVISVGAGNGYGHPAPETLAVLAEGGVPLRRTDMDGEVVIEVRGDGWSVG
jgi:competence protein ComEC